MFVHYALQVHRWGSALPAKPFGSPCLTAESALLAACGDFCLGAGVENAVLSGKAAAEAISSLLATSPRKQS
jgi:predicted NAD/FAD-dependent oxidoreductase